MSTASVQARSQRKPDTVSMVDTPPSELPALPVETPALGERRRRVAEAAYFRAERRGFAPGCELDDWLAAEQELDATGAGQQAKHPE